MCRRTVVLRAILLAFGTGILLGALLGGGICCVLLGIAAIVAGLCLCRFP